MLLNEFLNVIGHRWIIVHWIVRWVAMVSQILEGRQRNGLPSPRYQRLTSAYTGVLRSRASALPPSDDEIEKLGARSHTYWWSCCFAWSQTARAKGSKGHDLVRVHEAHADCMPSSARAWNSLQDNDVSRLDGEVALIEKLPVFLSASLKTQCCYGKRLHCSLPQSGWLIWSEWFTLLCKTLCGSARLAACPAMFCWIHRQMHAGGR